MKAIISEQPNGIKELRIFDEDIGFGINVKIPLTTQKVIKAGSVYELDYGAEDFTEDDILDFAQAVIEAVVDLKKYKFKAKLDYVKQRVVERL